MSFRLLSHVNRDDDLLEAWLCHYMHMGVGEFHLIVHGGEEQNRTLYAIKDRYPIRIIDRYAGSFDVFEKRDRLMWGLSQLRAGWVLLVDSDEFLELPYGERPYGTVPATVAVMSWLRADAISAPMLQRLADGGRLEPLAGRQPFQAFPWCSVDLYTRLGQPQAVIDKYPLFLLGPRTALKSGGNHYPPNGLDSRIAPMRGVTHHFKWRATAAERLTSRANSTHPYRSESVQYLDYLERADWRLPMKGAFRDSRQELIRRGLLTRASVRDLVRRQAIRSETAAGKALPSYAYVPQFVARTVADAERESVVVVGAGQGGRLFVQALRRVEVPIACVTDRDSSKWGTEMDGLVVRGLDEAFEQGHRVFVVGSLTHVASMSEQVRARARQYGVEVRIYTASLIEAVA